MPMPINRIKAGKPKRVDTRVANTPATRSRPNKRIKKSVLKIGAVKHITSFFTLIVALYY